MHSLPWSELLTLEEAPFESLEAAVECVNILAPWWDESTCTIKHAEAVVVRKGVLKWLWCLCMYLASETSASQYV